MDEKDRREEPAAPPGEGEGIEEASKEAVRQIEEREKSAGNAGYGDIG